MRRKTRIRYLIQRLLETWIPALLIVIFCLGPFLWLVMTSLKPEVDIMTDKVRYIPRRLTLENYEKVFSTARFGTYFRNSVIVALGVGIISLAVSISAAYAFSRYNFRGRNTLLTAILLAYMFPAVLLMIPLYVIFKGVGLINTPWAIMLAHCTITVPYCTWTLAGFFDTLPVELEEAAMVDGCRRFEAFLRVILPLSLPGIAATTIFITIVSWNEYLYALLLTTGVETRTLPVAIQMFLGGEYMIEWGILAAASVVTVIPTLVLFVFVQRQFISGLAAGAVKG